MLTTGGQLNELNRRAYTSTPANSVPVMALIRRHNPGSAADLVRLIADHRTGTCACGIRSQGTVEEFGRRLFAAQQEHWSDTRFTVEECIEWQYVNFITNCLKAARTEEKARALLVTSLLAVPVTGSEIRRSNPYTDEKLRVDIEVFWEGRLLCGVQVKPLSYQSTSAEIQAETDTANARYGAPVLFLYYDHDEEFSGQDEFFESVGRLIGEQSP